MHTEDIAYQSGGGEFVGYLAFDETREGKRPGVLLAPEGGGLGNLAKSIARKLAAEGFVVFAMDYYGNKPITDMTDAMARMQALMTPPAPIRAIARAALEVLAAQPQTDPAKLAAIGYCFGGTTALELARAGAPIKAAVGFHSGLYTSQPAQPGAVKAVVLTHIGVEDPFVPAEQRAGFELEMAAAGVDWRMIVYGGAGHSFTNPDVGAMGRPGFEYNAAADARSWRAMLDVFEEVFGKG